MRAGRADRRTPPGRTAQAIGSSDTPRGNARDRRRPAPDLPVLCTPDRVADGAGGVPQNDRGVDPPVSGGTFSARLALARIQSGPVRQFCGIEDAPRRPGPRCGSPDGQGRADVVSWNRLNATARVNAVEQLRVDLLLPRRFRPRPALGCPRGSVVLVQHPGLAGRGQVRGRRRIHPRRVRPAGDGRHPARRGPWCRSAGSASRSGPRRRGDRTQDACQPCGSRRRRPDLQPPATARRPLPHVWWPAGRPARRRRRALEAARPGRPSPCPACADHRRRAAQVQPAATPASAPATGRRRLRSAHRPARSITPRTVLCVAPALPWAVR